jgi:D-alanyl-D-alanine dipeptidase
MISIFSCAPESNKLEDHTNELNKQEKTEDMQAPCSLADSICNSGLINVQHLNDQIKVNLRYSGRNNFLKTDVYGCLEDAYLQKDVAVMLDNAQQNLTSLDSNLHLMIWDAVRPRSVQWKMWNTLKMPLDEKVKYVSNPRNGSIHNYGCAIDLTICFSDGKLMDMGTDFDYFGKAANTKSEYLLVNDSIITYQQLDNRKILRKAMKSAGFSIISTEWWHFNAISRADARSRYTIVK